MLDCITAWPAARLTSLGQRLFSELRRAWPNPHGPAITTMPDLAQIRNIGIIAHIDAGKTTTSERMLFYAGQTHRLGEVDEGTTVMDYLDEERARGITIVSAAASFPWRDALIHLIDTPGHIDFTAEVERSLRVSDGAVVIFSGVEGVEAQSEKVWHQADHYHIPRLAFINKLDRIGAGFDRVVDEINAKFGGKAVPVQMPVGVESEFGAVINLLTLELIRFGGNDGEDVQVSPVPPEWQAEAAARRVAMIEKLADCSDPIAERYLSDGQLDAAFLRPEIRRLTLATRIVPIFAGSSKRNLGVQPLLDGVVDYLPSPLDIGQVSATTVKKGETVTLSPDPGGPLAVLVFKVIAFTTADLYYLRTYSGTLRAGDSVYVPRLRTQLRAKRLLRLYANDITAVPEVGPGDIIGMDGPRGLATGDTLCQSHRQLLLESMDFPEPVISMALEPRSSRDKERLDDALALLCREDPTLKLRVDENTGQRLLSGMGELHLEIKAKRLETELKVPVKCGEPRVAYRETLRREISVSATFHKVVGETELLAGATIRLRPLPATESLFKVTHDLAGDRLPPAVLDTAVSTLTNGLKTGGLNGYPLIYVEGRLEALDLHLEKSTEGAVAGAVLQALDQAIREAGTVILEPMMRLEITTTEDTIGEVSMYLQSRRALIVAITDITALKRVQCEVPLAEMFGFSKALPKITGGRGSFSMEPCGYKELPDHAGGALKG